MGQAIGLVFIVFQFCSASSSMQWIVGKANEVRFWLDKWMDGLYSPLIIFFPLLISSLRRLLLLLSTIFSSVQAVGIRPCLILACHSENYSFASIFFSR